MLYREYDYAKKWSDLKSTFSSFVSSSSTSCDLQFPEDLAWIVTDTISIAPSSNSSSRSGTPLSGYLSPRSNNSSKKSEEEDSSQKKDDLLPFSPQASHSQHIRSSEIAFLQYTSGSTSNPKGVMISHGNLIHNLTSIITSFGFSFFQFFFNLQKPGLNASKSTVVVSWLPQYHDMGLIGSYLALMYCGGSGNYFYYLFD